MRANPCLSVGVTSRVREICRTYKKHGALGEFLIDCMEAHGPHAPPPPEGRNQTLNDEPTSRLKIGISPAVKAKLDWLATTFNHPHTAPILSWCILREAANDIEDPPDLELYSLYA